MKKPIAIAMKLDEGDAAVAQKVAGSYSVVWRAVRCNDKPSARSGESQAIRRGPSVVHFKVVVLGAKVTSAPQNQLFTTMASNHQKGAALASKARSGPPYLTEDCPPVALPALQPISRADAACNPSLAGAKCSLQPLSGTRRAPITARRGACVRISVEKPWSVRCAIPVVGTLAITLFWES